MGGRGGALARILTALLDCRLSKRHGGFYYLEKDGILRSMDLIYPEGFGEAVSGGEREHEYERVKQLISSSGESPSQYSQYLTLLKAGIPPSCGFGIGLERLTRYICGLEHISDATAFPKIPGIASF